MIIVIKQLLIDMCILLESIVHLIFFIYYWNLSLFPSLISQLSTVSVQLTSSPIMICLHYLPIFTTLPWFTTYSIVFVFLNLNP